MHTFEFHRKRSEEITEAINKIKLDQASDTNITKESNFNEKNLGIADFSVSVVDEKL